MDSEQYLCPGKHGNLILKTVYKSTVNYQRKYLTCPYIEKNGEKCGFFSFLNELKLCECGNAYCRNMFKGEVKYWCCPLKGTNACGFVAPVVMQDQPTRTPSTPCQPSTSTSTQSTSTATSTEEKLAETLLKSVEVIHCLVKKLHLDDTHQ
ncbi:hypothetical protein QQ045_020614 [Rhodiola kirilowii]